MGAYSFLEGKKIKFWKVETLTDEELFEEFPDLKEYEEKFNQLDPGTILFSDPKVGLYIKTIEGDIKVLEIQGENAKRMDVKDFLRGNQLYACSVFE